MAEVGADDDVLEEPPAHSSVNGSNKVWTLEVCVREGEVRFIHNMPSGVDSDRNAWNDWNLKIDQAPSKTSQASALPPPQPGHTQNAAPLCLALHQPHGCPPHAQVRLHPAARRTPAPFPPCTHEPQSRSPRLPHMPLSRPTSYPAHMCTACPLRMYRSPLPRCTSFPPSPPSPHHPHVPLPSRSLPHLYMHSLPPIKLHS